VFMLRKVEATDPTNCLSYASDAVGIQSCISNAGLFESVIRGVVAAVVISVSFSISCSSDSATNPVIAGASGTTGAGGVVTGTAPASTNAGSVNPGAGGTTATTVNTAGQMAKGGQSGQAGSAGKKTTAAAGARAGSSGANQTAGAGGKPATETCNQIPPPSSDCSAKLSPGDDRTCTIQVAGQERTYLLFAPKLYNPCKPTPLVVDAHGFSETAPEEAGLESFCSAPPFPTGCYPNGTGSGMRIMAKHEGFITAHPQGIGNAWGAADADFMAEVVKEVKKVANIDATKVYMTGISNGGMLTYQTGCKYSDVFTAIIPHAGSEQSFGACAAITKPMPVLAWVSETDALVPYAQSRAAVENWAKLNNCQNGPKESHRYGGPEADDSHICYPGPNVEPDANQPPPFTTYEELIPCPNTGKVTICETWDKCDGGVEVMICRVAPDTENAANNQVGGHVLFVNDTKLFVSSVTWPFLKKFWSTK
jgi:poly(3-hydroxybutyrate) depolymerase